MGEEKLDEYDLMEEGMLFHRYAEALRNERSDNFIVEVNGERQEKRQSAGRVETEG